MTHHLDTRAVHVRVPELVGSSPVGVPLYQNTIFAFDGVAAMADAVRGPHGAFAYAGYANPTVRAPEDAVADLEGGAAVLATATGMAAIDLCCSPPFGKVAHVYSAVALVIAATRPDRLGWM